jgi:hypothetical protein
MSLFPWSRSPYDPVPDEGLRMLVLPAGALVDAEWLEIERQRGAQQEEHIRARAKEREAAVRAAAAEAEADKAAEREQIKREVLADLRAAGILPS